MPWWSVGLSQCAFSEHRPNLIINPINQSFFYIPSLKDIKAKYVNQYVRNYDDKISNSNERIKFMGPIFISFYCISLLYGKMGANGYTRTPRKPTLIKRLFNEIPHPQL